MTQTCTYRVCDAPFQGCNLGREEFADCKYWGGRGSNQAPPDEKPQPQLPWSGAPLGHLDLEVVAARSRPYLIGLLGSHDAGKTTLLAVLYLLLWRGERVGERLFAGSMTLDGWEGLASALRWQPDQPPQFPPHTSRAADRTPGLLHLAFRHRRVIEDVLFTDAPGEWFDEWSVNRNSAGAEGARWTARHANAVLLVVDSEALAGPDGGVARMRTLDLARRLGDELEAGRRVAVVWSKSDQEVPVRMREMLTTAFEKCLPGYREFNVSIYPIGESEDPDTRAFLELFDWCLGWDTTAPPNAVPSSVDNEDPFLSFRGHSV